MSELTDAICQAADTLDEDKVFVPVLATIIVANAKGQCRALFIGPEGPGRRETGIRMCAMGVERFLDPALTPDFSSHTGSTH